MSTATLAVGIMFGIVTVCYGQTREARKPPSDCKVILVKQGTLLKSLHGESYKRSPLLKFDINEDGTTTNVRIIRGSGVSEVDRKLAAVLRNSKYKPRPGCGIVKSGMTVDIDWR